MAISLEGRPIDFVFDPSVGFSRRRIEWTYFRLYQIQDSAARHLGIFRMNSGMSYPIHFHELQSSFGGIQEK